ncbi:siderophore ABC transporter substrate-binding protein [Arsenicicoccus bolidensis]|uniref:siderophore ABC transporter substrate-binding protein n=1 Tax=Arsenicicoccus bolidensis TaxID=229480 RepID=UPI0004187E92|nr:siderophore ABC transporter substrate-binding protein [Arsenicicoccus bolidensis]
MSSRLLTPARTAILATVALSTAACGSASAGSGSSGSAASSDSAKTVSITHAQGTTQVPVQPKKVAVLDMGVLDSLQSMGVDSVAAVTKQGMPTFLKAYQDTRYTDLGSMKEPDVEKLAAAGPDLIIVGARGAAKYKELSKIAPTIDLTVGSKDLLGSAKKVNTQLGEIFGKQEQVTAKHAALDAKVTAAKAKAANAGTGLILMTSGGKVSAFGPQSRFGLIHQTLGVKPTSATISEDRHGQAVSFEFIRDAKPDRLFVVDRDAAIGQNGKAAKEILANPLVDATPAGAKKQMTYLDGQRWYVVGAGLDNLSTMVDEVAAGL